MIVGVLGALAFQFAGRAKPACEAKRYDPSYVPKGVVEVPFEEETPHAWFRTWEGRGVELKIIGGFVGEVGDDPAAKPVKGLGYGARIGPIGDGILAIDWTEIPSEECAIQYVVSARGMSEKGLIRVARSLRVR
jgi:hypothetical protein